MKMKETNIDTIREHLVGNSPKKDVKKAMEHEAQFNKSDANDLIKKRMGMDLYKGGNK